MALAKLVICKTFTLKLYRAKLHQVDVVLEFDESIIEVEKACIEIITCFSVLIEILRLH